MTVSDVMTLLSLLPAEARISVTGPDFGGYDVMHGDAVGVRYNHEKKIYRLEGIDQIYWRLAERIAIYEHTTTITQEDPPPPRELK